jgi:hypothetical protein
MAAVGVEYADMMKSSNLPFPTRWIERSLPPADPLSVERRDWINEQIRRDRREFRSGGLRGDVALRYVEALRLRWGS